MRQRPPGLRTATASGARVIRTSPLTVRTRRLASGPSARVGVSLVEPEPTEPLTELTSSLTRRPRRIATTTSPETALRPTSPGPAAHGQVAGDGADAEVAVDLADDDVA